MNNKVAVAFTGIQNGATVDNIKITNCNVESSGTNAVAYVGTISAENDGYIQNCKVSSSDENTIKTSEKYSRVGGVVGKSKKQLKNVTVDGYSIVLEYLGIDTNAYLGGICGILEDGILHDCHFTNGFIENETYNGSLNVGGVVANIWNGTQVYRCLAEGFLKSNTLDENKKIGGVVSTSNGGEIIASYFKGSISGNNIAGVCVINSGTIDQCYADCELTGIEIGGIAVANNKIIKNCFIRGTLTGLTEDSLSCGICVTLPEGSSVENCFAKLDFSSRAKGMKYAETKAYFRADTERWIGNLNLFGWYEDYKEPTGTFTNSIIVYSGDGVEVQHTLFGQKTGWIDCSDSEAQGTTGDYAKFKVNAKFDQSIWVFESGYPTLKNVPVLDTEE